MTTYGEIDLVLRHQLITLINVRWLSKVFCGIHLLNEDLLITEGFLWHSPESNYTGAHELNPSCMLEDYIFKTLHWRHNEPDGVSNYQPRECLLNCLFMCRSKKTSKLRVTGLCAENSPGTGEFPAQKASNAENASIWWRHHVITIFPRGQWVDIYCPTQ